MAGSHDVEKFESTPQSSSLNSDNISLPPAPLPAPAQNMEVEHNSRTPLPSHWNQYWDLRTGEVYYINWRNGIRTSADPRISEEEAEAAGFFPSDDEDDDDDDDSWEDGDENYQYFGGGVVNAEDYRIPDSYESTSDASSDSLW